MQNLIEAVRKYGLIGLTVGCLLALLTYTFFHTGALLAEYVAPWQVGYVAAFGIEAAILAMSTRLGTLLRKKKSVSSALQIAWQGLTLLFVLGVSAVANVAEGFKVKYGTEFTATAIQQLDNVQIVVGLLATALIPVVVLSMSEIISGEIKDAMHTPTRDDETPVATPVTAHVTPAVQRATPVAHHVTHDVAQTRTAAHSGPQTARHATPVQSSETHDVTGSETVQHTHATPVQSSETLDVAQPTDDTQKVSHLVDETHDVAPNETVTHKLPNGVDAAPIDAANDARMEDVEQRRRWLYEQVRQLNGHVTWSALADEIGVSRATIYRDRDHLESVGALYKEGDVYMANGWHETAV